MTWLAWLKIAAVPSGYVLLFLAYFHWLDVGVRLPEGLLSRAFVIALDFILDVIFIFAIALAVIAMVGAVLAVPS